MENFYVEPDHGPEPIVLDIKKAASQNGNYRSALWTGGWLQVTLMCIPPHGEIGLEIHPGTDQFLEIVEGGGVALMGESEKKLDFKQNVMPGSAIIIPAGTWHNVVNRGITPLKLFSIYAPPHHPWGTVQPTKADADREEGH